MTNRLSITVVLFLASFASAQLAPSHGTPPAQPASPHSQMSVKPGSNPHGKSSSSLKTFAADCGVTDLSQSKVAIFASEVDPKWRAIPVDSEGKPTDTSIARAFSDASSHVRVVDISKSNSSGDVLQVSRMCFSPSGSLRKVSEHYVNIPSCACGRQTEAAFDEQGKQTKSSESFYKVPSHDPINAPDAAAKFPPLLSYKSLAALPFANLLKGRN